MRMGASLAASMAAGNEKRRANQNVAVFDACHERAEFLNCCFGGVLVHFPIARNDGLSHKMSGKKLVPFSICVAKIAATVWPKSESVERKPRFTPARTSGPAASSGTYSRL